MEDKTLVQIVQECCQGIAEEAFSPGEINHLRVEKTELSLSLEVIPSKKQVDKKSVEKLFTEKLKRKLAASVKVKVKFL